MRSKFILIASVFFFIGSGFGLLTGKMSSNDSTKQTVILNDIKSNWIIIEPYRLDTKEGKLTATFKLESQQPENEIGKVTYWTDKNGACSAKTVDFSKLIDVSVDDATYTFFQLTDKQGKASQIYASSHHPIFQCGTLAE